MAQVLHFVVVIQKEPVFAESPQRLPDGTVEAACGRETGIGSESRDQAMSHVFCIVRP